MTPSLIRAGLEKFKRVFRRKRRLQSDILIQYLTLLILSIFSIIGYDYYNNSIVIIKQSETYLSHFSEFLETQINKALHDAENLVKIYTPLLSRVDLDNAFQDPAFLSLVNSMNRSLASYNHISTLYFGTPKGRFIEVILPETLSPYLAYLGSSIPDNTTSVLKAVQAPSLFAQDTEKLVQESQEQWIYVLGGNHFSTPRTGEKTGYDPRKRNWYTGAFGGSHIQWTDVYTFASILRKEKGITASQAIYDDGVKFKGVFATDITLRDFSDFLASRKITPNAFAYVLGKGHQELASSISNGREHLDTMDAAQYKAWQKKKQLGEDLLTQVTQLYAQQKRTSNLIHFQFQDEPYVAHFNELEDFFQHNWKIVLIAPLKDFVGQIQQGRNQTFIYSLLILALAFVLAYRLAKNISRPIIGLAHEANKIQQLDFSTKSMIPSRIKEIAELSSAMGSLKSTVQSFSVYIPKTLVKNLINRKQHLEIGGNVQEVSLMFTDIENFTTISETMLPDKLVKYLSDYFEELTSLILESGGTVDKYLGDAIMAFWGAPVADKDHLYKACRTALLCQRRLYELNRLWKRQNRPLFRTRIGIHVGKVVVGNIGSSERMNYTVIGDEVNLASRLEGLNKHYGTYTLISEPVYDVVKEIFLCRPLDQVAVKGKQKSILIFELMGQLQGDDALYPTEEQIALCRGFEEAYGLYRQADWKRALAQFKTLSADHPHDPGVQLYLKRCETLLKTPPKAGWDGVTVMTEK